MSLPTKILLEIYIILYIIYVTYIITCKIFLEEDVLGCNLRSSEILSSKDSITDLRFIYCCMCNHSN